MSFIESLQYPFQDKNWVNKIVITIVLLIIPILGWFAFSGYAVRVIRNILNGRSELPEYDDFGGDFGRGFTVFLGSLVYYIPSIILACCQQIAGTSDNGGLNALGCLISIVQLGYYVLMTPVLMSALARFSVNEEIGVFFDFAGRLNDVLSHTGEVVMLYINLVLMYIVGYIAIAIGLVLCCIPGLIAAAALTLGYVHMTAMWGQTIGVGGGGFTSSAASAPIEPLA